MNNLRKLTVLMLLAVLFCSTGALNALGEEPNGLSVELNITVSGREDLFVLNEEVIMADAETAEETAAIAGETAEAGEEPAAETQENGEPLGDTTSIMDEAVAQEVTDLDVTEADRDPKEDEQDETAYDNHATLPAPGVQDSDLHPTRTLLAIIQDALAPDCAIYIYGHWEGEVLRIGQTVTLEAVLEGYDEVEYTLQWQCSMDGETWVDIEEAVSNEYSFILTRENVSAFWRVQVIITGVKEA